MKRRDIHHKHEFFEYVRLDGSALPPADQHKIDVAVLDMNHSWPNVGHDALVHAILEAAEERRNDLKASGKLVRQRGASSPATRGVRHRPLRDSAMIRRVT